VSPNSSLLDRVICFGNKTLFFATDIDTSSGSMAMIFLRYYCWATCFRSVLLSICMVTSSVLLEIQLCVLYWVDTLQAQGVVCNSSFTRDYLKPIFSLIPTHVINPMIRPEAWWSGNFRPCSPLRADVRRERKHSEQAVVILSVGRLVRRKGFDHVIENLPVLLADLDVYYLICGQGPMEPELKSLSAD